AKNMTRPIGIVRFNNIFKLPQNYVVTANFSWRGKGDSENVRLKQTWQFDLSLKKNINQNCDITLSANDILNTSRHNGFKMYSNSKDIYIDKIGNARSFELTFNYRFNYTKSKYKGKGAGKEEKERLN
ncbi:MAG: outer membrane beta-barrel protein, partial [Muribaculaceae bacterium]